MKNSVVSFLSVDFIEMAFISGFLLEQILEERQKVIVF